MKAVIIDDEVNNITNLTALLKQYCPSVTVCGVAMGADEGLALIRQEEPDIVFLDIQMPGKNGFDLLNEIHTRNFQVVFVTAFDNYAIRAIKFSALDYLLKPINVNELVAAVNKAEEKYRSKISTGEIENLLTNLRKLKTDEEKIALPMANEIRFVRVKDILYCQSENNYTLFFLEGGEKIIVSRGLYEYEELLPASDFIRCHQSYIVNRHFVKSLVNESGISYLLTINGSNIPVSRSKKEYVKSRMMG